MAARTGNGRRFINKTYESLADKQKKAGVTVSHNKAKSSAPGKNTLNRNQVRTADGVLSQGYNTETKQFEKTTSRTKSGLMAVEGSNSTKGAITWAMTPKNDDGTPVINEKTGQARQSGRSRLANRSKRNYDVRAGLNNITPKALQAMIDAGEVRVVEGGGLQSADGIMLTQKKNGNYSMGLSNG